MSGKKKRKPPRRMSPLGGYHHTNPQQQGAPSPMTNNMAYEAAVVSKAWRWVRGQMLGPNHRSDVSVDNPEFLHSVASCLAGMVVSAVVTFERGDRQKALDKLDRTIAEDDVPDIAEIDELMRSRQADPPALPGTLGAAAEVFRRRTENARRRSGDDRMLACVPIGELVDELGDDAPRTAAEMLDLVDALMVDPRSRLAFPCPRGAQDSQRHDQLHVGRGGRGLMSDISIHVDYSPGHEGLTFSDTNDEPILSYRSGSTIKDGRGQRIPDGWVLHYLVDNAVEEWVVGAWDFDVGAAIEKARNWLARPTEID